MEVTTMSKRHKWALRIVLVVVILLAARVVWVALYEPDNEYPLIARPYNEYTFPSDDQ